MGKLNLRKRAAKLRLADGSLTRDFAELLVRESAVWFQPEKVVRARRHASRIRYRTHGWEIAFGSNTLRIQVAFDRSLTTLHALATTASPDLSEYRILLATVGQQIRGAVADYKNREYPGFYHAGKDVMRFGTQGIYVDYMAEAILDALSINRPDYWATHYRKRL